MLILQRDATSGPAFPHLLIKLILIKQPTQPKFDNPNMTHWPEQFQNRVAIQSDVDLGNLKVILAGLLVNQLHLIYLTG